MLVVPQREFQQFVADGKTASFEIRRPRNKGRIKGRAQVILVTLVLTMFLLGLALTSLTADLNAKGLEVYQLQQETERLENENQRLGLEISRLQSPERIQQVAAEKLGMVLPDSGDVQMVRLDSDSDLGFSLAAQDNFRELPDTGVDARVASRPRFRYEGIAQAVASWLVNPSPEKSR